MSRKSDPPRFYSVKLNPNVLFRRLGADEMVLFHLETDRFYELNGTAARFLELLHQSQDVAQVHQQMVGEFAVDGDRFQDEAEVLLSSLQREDLISVDE